MPNIGPGELIVVLVIALLVLGPKRLPDAGRSLGNGIREFKDSISGSSKNEALDTSHFASAQAAPQPVAAAVPAPVAPAVAPAPAPAAVEHQPAA